MYSDKGIVLEAFLKSYLSCASSTQAQEAKEILLKTISDIDNGNLTQEKSIESEQENKSAEPKRQRAPKVPLTDSLVQLIYNTAKKYPNYSFSKLEEKLNLTDGYIKNQRRVIVFKGRKTKLSTVVKLARLMDGKNLSRYEREEDYTEE